MFWKLTSHETLFYVGIKRSTDKQNIDFIVFKLNSIWATVFRQHMVLIWKHRASVSEFRCYRQYIVNICLTFSSSQNIFLNMEIPSIWKITPMWKTGLACTSSILFSFYFIFMSFRSIVSDTFNCHVWLWTMLQTALVEDKFLHGIPWGMPPGCRYRFPSEGK